MGSIIPRRGAAILGGSMSLIDPHDFCRACRGRGYDESFEYSATAGTRTLQTFTCMFCDGRGVRTVIVLGERNGKTSDT